MSDNKRMGSSSVDAVCAGVRFGDGTYQTTAANPQANTIQCGVVFIISSTSETVTYGTPYTCTSTPITCVTPLDGTIHDVFYTATPVGSSNNWTGFTLSLSASVGMGSFGYIVMSNPN